MKALGVALAACCAVVFWPSAAHADPIGARVGATTVEHTAIVTDDGDATFTVQGGLDRSINFADTGRTEVFDDDRVSLGDVIDLEGLGLMLHDQITLGLRTTGHHGDNDRDDRGAGISSRSESDSGPGEGSHQGLGGGHRTAATLPALPHGPKVTEPQGGGGVTTSATPEPASMLLLATGLAGVLLYRRRLFA